MTNAVRHRIAAATTGIMVATFPAFLWLFFADFSSRPNAPLLGSGLVHPLFNHGSTVYISDADSTSLALLIIAFGVSFALTIAIIPKQFALPALGTPKWLIYVSGSFKIIDGQLSRDRFFIFVGSILICWVIIVLAGPAIVHFAITNGVVLNL